MTTYYPDLAHVVRRQADALPEVYGDVDFSGVPYRFTTDPDVESALPAWVGGRSRYLSDERIVELMTTSTMLGDVVADRYAALAADHSVSELISMLRTACREGIDAVEDAPSELASFLEAMETTPDWIDLDLVAEGARLSRVPSALLSPFITRGAFIATFTNLYAALPMVMTGALTGKRAARRVNETTSFFAVTTLPGALDRDGAGFEAAAMVRLMHSMVRYNALRRSGTWDVDTYGIPIPQLDQAPAGLMGAFILAQRALRQGRSEFTRAERATVEFHRYRCFLLGLPEELVPATPRGVVDVFTGRAALLRAGFDGSCASLVSSTMNAYLRSGHTAFDRAAESVERSYSKIAFMIAFCQGNRRAAARMGVEIAAADFARIAVTAPFIVGRLAAAQYATRIPFLAPHVDRYATRMVERRLADYGKPEFRTDHTEYAVAH